MDAKDSADKKKRPDVRSSGSKEQECIWMEAGVVNFKLCDYAYDCLNCPFDKAMSEAWGARPER